MSKIENNRRKIDGDSKFSVDTLYDIRNWIIVILGHIDTKLIKYSWEFDKTKGMIRELKGPKFYQCDISMYSQDSSVDGKMAHFDADDHGDVIFMNN